MNRIDKKMPLYPLKKLTDKNEVVKWIELYLTEEDNSLADLNSLIPNLCPPSHAHEAYIRDIAHKMKRSGKYELVEGKIGDDIQYFVRPLPPKKWPERSPFWFAVTICFITAALTVLGEWLVSRKESREQFQRDSRQETHLTHLNDSLKILQNNLADSTAMLKADTLLLNK